jgi:hypothetical protein
VPGRIGSQRRSLRPTTLRFCRRFATEVVSRVPGPDARGLRAAAAARTALVVGYRAISVLEPTDPSGSANGASSRTREGRLAKNEIFFREANELIERDAAVLDGNVDFICECSSSGCVERLMLTRGEYEHVRAKGNRFVVVAGHENTSVEHVVETRPTYLVVEKHGRAGIDADRADPRESG